MLKLNLSAVAELSNDYCLQKKRIEAKSRQGACEATGSLIVSGFLEYRTIRPSIPGVLELGCALISIYFWHRKLILPVEEKENPS